MRDREKAKKRLISKMDDLRKVLDELQDALGDFHKSEEIIHEKIIEYEKLSALGRLTANVAHEIRNPITVIGGLTERIRRNFVHEPKQKEYLDLISVEVKRLEEILKAVRIFSDKAIFRRELKDIAGIIDEVLSNFRLAIDNASININILSADVPHVYIDERQVRAALGNLISNAIDAMPDGGTLTIAIKIEPLSGKKYVAVAIIDTGTGISEENLKMLYEPFFTTKREKQETGLGLAIARRIIEGHGGLIKAESSLGKGSVFTLYFPYRT
jgi:signal transduction histidine kinase